MKLVEQLFEKYSSNLYAVTSRIKGMDPIEDRYACPVCLKLFERRHLFERSENHLTDEHVPPRSVGWEVRVLTCKSCNSTQGGKLESQILKSTNVKAFFSREPGIKLSSRFVINDEIISDGSVTITNDRELHFHLDPNRTSPYNKAKIDSVFIEGNPTPDIKMEAELGNERFSSIAKLRIAYLWAFAELGYGYILDKSLNSYRESILNPDESEFYKGKIFKADFPNGVYGLNILRSPVEYGCYLVVLNLKSNGYSEKVGVILPGSTPRAYDLIRNFNSCTSKVKLDFDVMNNLEVVTNTKSCFLPNFYWYETYDKSN